MSRPLSLVSVTSSQNDVFTSLSTCVDGRGDFVLVHGLKLIHELLTRTPSLVLKNLIARESFYSTMTSADPSHNAKLGLELFTRRFESPITRISLLDKLFDDLDPVGVPDAMAAFVKPHLAKLSEVKEPNGATLVTATQNPANLGALIRSASAFGFKNLVTLKEAAHPYHARTVRGSMGHVFDLKCFQGPSIASLRGLPEAFQTRLVTLDLEGEPLHTFNWPQNPIVLIGEEGRGVPDAAEGLRVNIPHLAHVNSLNAAVSGGIAMYDYYEKTLRAKRG